MNTQDQVEAESVISDLLDQLKQANLTIAILRSTVNSLKSSALTLQSDQESE